MKRVKQKKTTSTAGKAGKRESQSVPLMVPHGGAAAGSDFESAFEMLQGDDRARELWRRGPGKIPFGRSS